MIDRKEIELLIRAQLKGGRDIATITKSIAALEEAIESQASAAKKGESSIDGLKASLAALKSIQDELGARSTNLKRLQDLNKLLADQKTKVDAAKAALDAYEKANAGDRTDAQQKRVQKLTATYQAAQKQLVAYQHSTEVLQAALRESGEDTGNLGAALRRVADAQGATAAAQNRLNAEIAEYATTIQRTRDATAKYAADQEKLARLVAGNEADARLAAQQRQARAKRDEQIEADRLARLIQLGKAQAQLRGGQTADSELASIRDSEKFVRDRQGQLEQRAVKDTGLRKQADDAERAAKSYTTLARAAQEVRPKIGGLRQAVEDLANPAAASRQSLGGIETQIRQISSILASSTAPIKDYANQFKNLQEIQKAIAGQAGLLDSFRNQIQGLRENRNELVAARADVQKYAAAVRQGGDAGAAFVKPLADAQTRLQAAANAFREQITVTRATRESLRAAGIDTTNLANAQSRLIAATQGSQNAIQALNVAVDRNAQIARQATVDTGLRQQADDAEKAARSYTTLAKASRDLRPKIVTLREAIQEIIDPATKSRQTLDGVEQQIKEMSTAIAASKGPVKDYANQLKALQDAQRAIAGKAVLVDNYSTQLAALKANRQALVDARGEVQKYAAAVRQGGDAGAAFTKPLEEARVKLRAAQAAMRDQANATRVAREALRAAGIDTSNLAAAQTRLIGATRASSSALQQLTQNVERNGEATKRASKGFSLFRDEGRTTLSITQRLRGEVLALTASYLGVQGAIGLASGALKAFTERQGLANTLEFALGGKGGDDVRLVAEEIQYLIRQADRLGISFQEASKGYAKFAAAASKSGAGQNEIREVFESFSEVARVINLTPTELNGLFNAVGQSFSKGKIQAEELRQQIGERLPGAFAFAQEALKDIFPDLDKALEKGQVGAENMLLIAQSVRKAAEGQLPKAIQSLDAEQQRFNNSVLYFKQQIAEAGFADAYVSLLKQLTEYFKSTDGAEFAKSIGEIAKALASGVSFVVTYRDEVGLLFSLFASVLAAGMLSKIGGGVVALQTAFTGASVGAALLTPMVFSLASAMRALSVSVGVLIAGYSIGSYLYDQFVEVRKFGALIVTSYALAWSKVKYGAIELWEDMPRIASNGVKALLNEATKMIRGLLTIIRVGANALGMTDFAATIGKGIDALTFKYDKVSDKVAAIRKAGREDMERIRQIGKDMLSDLDDAARPAAAVGPDGSDNRFARHKRVVTPRKSKYGAEDDDKAAKKRADEIAALLNALEGIEAKALKKQGDTLESLLKAVDKEYADLERRIQKLGGKEGVEFAKRFKAALAGVKGEITADFNEKLLKEQQAITDKLDQIDATAGRKQKADLTARLAAIETQYEAHYREIQELRDKLLANNRSAAPADLQKGRLDGLVVELKNAERLKFLREQLEVKEASINDLLKARLLAVRAIENEVTAGAKTPSQGDEAIRTLIADAQPGIESATAAAAAFAETNRKAFDPNTLQEFLNKLAEAKNSGAAMNAEFDRTGQIIKSGIDQGITQSFNAMYDSLVGVINKTNDLGDVFDNAGKAMLQVLANVLKEIAMLIIREQILIQIQAFRIAMSGGGGGAGATGSAATLHSGGIVGRPHNRMREVDPGWFATAPRYHAGGFPGMAPNESAAILKRNEEVLAEGDPRNALNGGLQSKAAPAQPQRFVLVDDRSRVAEAMAGAEGEAVTMVNLRKNIPTLRQWLK